MFRVLVGSLFVVAVAVSGGCTSANSAVCDANRYCPDPSRPFCDLDGAVNGTPNSCIAIPECTAGQVLACSKDPTGFAIVCNANADNLDTDNCANGCDPSLGCKPCVDGATRCADDGSAILVCDATGHEDIQHSCPNGCTNDTCNACANGVKRCGDDGNVLVCGSDGRETILETCSKGCYDATCKTCLLGDKSCDSTNDNVLVCDNNGMQSLDEHCANGCFNNSCKMCAEGALTCDPTNRNVERCDASGAEVLNETCPNGCLNGACKACAEGAVTCGADGNVHVCGADGTETVMEACVAGCRTSPSPHCAYVEPQFLANVCDTAATDALNITTNTTLMTYSPAMCNGGQVSQTSDVSICVNHYKSISIGSAAKLSVTGQPVLALVADRDIKIDGTVDVSASHATPGSGAAFYVVGRSGGAGAGGSDFGGASWALDGSPVNGSPEVNDPLLSTVFHGGQNAGNNSGTGGGGGGGILIISCHGTLDIGGTVAANGGGGSPGKHSLDGAGHDLYSGGAGGGAGGAIVLQALKFNIHGAHFFANGGGGGGGMNSNLTAGGFGADGYMTTAAVGGSSTNKGGDGATGTTAPGAGTKPASTTPSNSGTPGGGGGAAGFVDLLAPAGVAQNITPGASSPNPATPKPCNLR